MPASLIQYRLRVRTVSTLANPDGLSDAFTVSSVPADTLPFIAAPPTGDGQEVDPITGAVRTGAYTLEIVDATTGTDGTGTIRALTSRLEDAQFRQQLLSRRAFLEIRTDGGAWGELVSGYVLGIRLVGPVRYALTIGDTRRVEQTQPIFAGSALGAYTTRGCLTGGPLTGDWGPVKARGGWRYRVQKLSGDDVELRFVEGYGTGSDSPVVRDFRKVARPEIPDAVATYAQPNPYAIGGTSQFVTAYTTPVYNAATNDWVIGGGIVPVVGTTANNAAAVRALVVGFSTPQATEVLGVSPLYLYWPSCPHSNGDFIYVSLTTFDITERTPLYLDAHPVDVVTAIWTQARVRFNPAGAWIAAIKSLIGDNVRIALRLTEAPVIAPFLESAIFGPFGVAARTTTAGLQELFPTRIRTDVLPTVTLGAASLRDTDALVFDLDEATAVSSIELTQSVFAPAVYIEGAAATNGTTVAQSTAAPLDGVLVSTVSQTAQYADPGITVFAGRNVAYKLPGMIHTATDFAPNVGAQLGAIALAMFDRYGRGASVTDAPVLAGTAAAALQVGDEVYYEGPSFPNKGYRIGESTVGARIMQVVRRTETPAGPLLKLSDSGLAAQPATAPTITIAKFTGSPTTTASFTITNAATLNTSGAISVAVEYASGSSAPTGAAEFARYTSVSPNTIPTGAVLLPPRTTAGQTMHVRARSEQAGLRPSAWTAWASVTLDAIPTITPFAIGTTTQTSAAISWTNTSSTLPIVVFAIAAGSAPANWAPYRLASIPPGSTSTIVRTLTGPSVAWTIGVAYELAGILGPVTSASVTTNSTLGTTGRPAGLQVITGLDDATQTQGIALALWPADQTLDLVIQRSTTSGSGFAEIARVAGSTPTYVDERPRDGVTYYYRIAHELGGFGLSPFTQEVSAIARGVGRDLVRPDAVTPVVSVATTEVGTTGTVTLTITDPQGRVTEVRFRDRTGTNPFGAWTVDSTVPYSYSATIPTTGFLDIEYEVNGYTAAGVAGLLAGGVESFDGDAEASMVSVVGTFTSTGGMQLAISADSDTASFRFATSTTSQPTLATTQAQTAINGRNYATTLAGPFVSGSTVFVSVLGYTAVSGGGVESVLFEYRFQRDSTGLVYSQCIATMAASTATQIVVTVTGTAASGSPTVQLVAVTGSAVLVSGSPPIGTPVASGTSWTFTRGAALGQPGGAQFRAVLAGTVSDDDFIEVPEQGRDTTPLASRARVLSTSATQVSVRYAVADPFPQGAASVTVAYQAQGTGTVTPASGGTITPASTLTEATGTFIDYTIDRPVFGLGTGRVTYTATAANRVSDSDAVDIPAQERDTIGLLTRVRATGTTATTTTLRVAVADPLPSVTIVSITGATPSTPGLVTTATPHGRTGTWLVTIAGNSSGGFNAAWTATTTAETTFTINTTTTIANGTGGTATANATIAVSTTDLGTVTQVGGGALPSPILVTPVATITEAAGTFFDFVVPRPTPGSVNGRITFTVSSANRTAATGSATVVAQDIIGPSLNIVTTPGATSFSLAVTFDGTPAFWIDNASQSVSGWTSPQTVTINRNAAGGATKVAAFAVTKSSIVTSDSVSVPAQDTVAVAITSFSITYDYANDEIDYNYTITGLPTGYDIRCFAFLNGIATGELIEASSTSTQTIVGSPVPLDSSGTVTNNWEHWFEVTDGVAQVLATSVSVYGTTYEP